MKQSTTWKNKGILWILLVILAGLIVCPLIMVFAEAVIIDGRLDLHQAWAVITGMGPKDWAKWVSRAAPVGVHSSPRTVPP